MTQPREISAVVHGFGSLMFGVTARWKKHNDQWMIALTGTRPGSNYTGEEVAVESSKGVKKVILGEKVSDWGNGSYYLPERRGDGRS